MEKPSNIAAAVSENRDQWLSLMKARGCEGEFFKLSKRIIDSMEKDIAFHEAFSESEQIRMLVDMIFDAGFYAGRAEKRGRC